MIYVNNLKDNDVKLKKIDITGIALVLFPFLISSKQLRVITQPMRSKLGVGISLTSKSNCL